jgi:hypothetical protein
MSADLALTGENYYSLEANRAYMSNSQWGDWLKCEAAAYAEYVVGGDAERPGTVTDAGGYCAPERDYFVLGKWMHEMVLQSDGWSDRALALSHATIGRSRVMRTAKGQWNATGEKLNRMLARWQQEEDLHGLMVGQKEVLLTGAIGGIPWRCAIDNLAPDFFSDLKTPRSLKPDWKESRLDVWPDGRPKRVLVPWYEVHNYLRQIAVYRYLCWLQDGVWRDPYLVAVSKDEQPLVRAFGWEEDELEARAEWELAQIVEQVPRIQALREGDGSDAVRCGSCQYCRLTDRSYGNIELLALPEVAP